MIKITTTYQIVSPESAEQGDFHEQGWHNEDGEVFNSPSEAAEYLLENFAHHPSESPSELCKSWSTDGDKDYQSGNETYYTYHIETFEPALKEINKLLKV